MQKPDQAPADAVEEQSFPTPCGDYPCFTTGHERRSRQKFSPGKPLLALPILALASLAPLRAEDAAPKPAGAYPLNTCVVSGEELGSMGDAYVHIYKEEGKPDREVRLCCKGCLKKFSKDPAKYVAKLDAAKPEDGKSAKPAADAHAGHNH